MLCDMHCHVDLFKKPERMVKDIEDAGVFTVAVTNTPGMYSDSLIHLRNCQYIRPALGLHPNANVNIDAELRKFVKLARTAKFVGEVGLDSHVSKDRWREQEGAFEKILEVTRENKCIITVHSRGREKAVLEYLRKTRKRSVIFHWYSGPLKLIEDIAADGHFFSVNLAMMSHVTSRRKVALFPREQVLTESDGPFARYKRRLLSPLDIKDTVSQIAILWDMSFDEAEKTITENLSRLAQHTGVDLRLSGQ